MTNLEKLMQMFLEAREEKKDCSSWVQVGTLTGDEMMTRRKDEFTNDERNREIELMAMKAKRLHAEADEDHAIFWNGLYKEHSLPSDGSYHLTDDGKILMKPKAKP